MSEKDWEALIVLIGIIIVVFIITGCTATDTLSGKNIRHWQCNKENCEVCE